jgi:hypothetical protein
MGIIPGSRTRQCTARAGVFLITVALIAGIVGCDYYPPCPCTHYPPSQNLEIRTWYDLDDVRNSLGGNCILMNDFNSTTPGYEGLASPTANRGKGWEPIGTFTPYCDCASFTGAFDGQGYEIRDLYINRPDESLVGLFGCVESDGAIKDIGMVNATVTGDTEVGGLVGRNFFGTVSNSYVIGNVSGNYNDGGLVGYNQGPVINCYATGNVVASGVVGNVGALMGPFSVGGLVGCGEEETVSDCYFTDNVTSYLSCADYTTSVGGLVGYAATGIVNDSYSKANVTGTADVGGLVGCNAFFSTISNSYFTGSVTGNSAIGGLVGATAGGSMGIETTVSNSYSTGTVSGNEDVGGLVGCNEGSTVSNSYSTGTVSGNEDVGGLVGCNDGSTVSNSYSTGSVSGNSTVGGLVGWNTNATVSDSFWDIETSGQAGSAGGIGRTTAQMQDIDTFSGAAWSIVTVANRGKRNASYIWNIVDGLTYPFLSWQP